MDKMKEEIYREDMEKLPSEMIKIINDTIKIYYNIKDEKITINDSTVQYNKRDKKCLSLLLGLLNSKNSASELLNDYDMEYNKIMQVLSLEVSKDITEKEIASIYVDEFKSLLKTFNDSVERYYTKTITPLILLINLFTSEMCGSLAFEDIYDTLELNEENFVMLMSIILTKISSEEEYFEQLNAQSKTSTEKPKVGAGVLEQLGMNPYNIDLSYGRDKEIKKLLISLLFPNKSVILVGPSGVGKTAIVEGLAHKIAKQEVPDIFLDKKIYSLNVAALVSGCQYIGMFEEKLNDLLNEITTDKNNILFIDEIHSIIGAGKGSNSVNDMANILKPYLASGRLKVIGATTDTEYEEYIMPDSALKRRFEVIRVAEPIKDDLKEICLNAISKLNLEMGMFFLDENEEADYVLNELIDLTSKSHRNYQDSVNNPDLIISIITRSFAIAKYYNKQVVDINDIIEAINDNDRLYQGYKNRIISHLKINSSPSLTLPKQHLKEKSKKIIKFPKVK